MAFFKDTFLRTKHITLYGLCLAVLVFVLKWLQWKLLIVDNSMEIYIGLIAVFFTVLGIWVARQLTKTKTVVVEKQVFVTATDSAINEVALQALQLSQREHEVLILIARGYSNAEIAEKLFLSLSTIKTHASNLFVKMDVKSRAQAIEKAKRLHLTA